VAEAAGSPTVARQYPRMSGRFLADHISLFAPMLWIVTSPSRVEADLGQLDGNVSAGGAAAECEAFAVRLAAILKCEFIRRA